MKMIRSVLALFLVATFSASMGDVAAKPLPSRFEVLDAAAPESWILLTNATIFVGDGSDPLIDYAVLIGGNEIVAVSPAGTVDAPTRSVVLDLAGKSIMPGIVGMHNHTHMPGAPLLSYTAPRLYLAAGVTTIQTAGSADAIGELRLTNSINAGEIPGPRIFASAPYITGPGGNASMQLLEDELSARRFVNEWAELGVTWFKLYRHTDPKIAAIVIDEAHRRGLKVTGHLCSITYAEAAALGIDRLEHGLNAASDFVTGKQPGECVPSRASKTGLDPNGPEVGALIDVLVSSDVAITSTLAIIESGFPHRPQADARSLTALEPARVEAYEARQKQLVGSIDSTTATPDYWKLIVAFERRFAAAGGRLVAGPDTGRHVLPGYGDQRNFELLVEAGFTVPEVIQIMTHNGALELGIGKETGLVAQGYRADIIVIEGDLLADPKHIREVELVFKGGVAYDPKKLVADVEGQVGRH